MERVNAVPALTLQFTTQQKQNWRIYKFYKTSRYPQSVVAYPIIQHVVMKTLKNNEFTKTS